MQRPVVIVLTAGVAALAVLLGACGSGSSSSPDKSGGAAQETPVAVEDNPPGDIPDNQAFVSYHSSAGGYTLDTPEGWARTESGPGVTFADKLNSIGVEITPQDSAPSVASVTAGVLPVVATQVEAFEKVKVEAVDLPSGPAVLIRYRANSSEDAVTGKKVRLEIDRYEIFKDGFVAAVSLSAPAGSDNVDVWRQISRSFTWD
jgi:hypothetical protein